VRIAEVRRAARQVVSQHISGGMHEGKSGHRLPRSGCSRVRPVDGGIRRVQTRLSSTAWYLKLEAAPELVQEEILARIGKYTTHYIFEADSVVYNTVDSEAAAALDTLFSA
jgi:hypothetical protein